MAFKKPPHYVSKDGMMYAVDNNGRLTQVKSEAESFSGSSGNYQFFQNQHDAKAYADSIRHSIDPEYDKMVQMAKEEMINARIGDDRMATLSSRLDTMASSLSQRTQKEEIEAIARRAEDIAHRAAKETVEEIEQKYKNALEIISIQAEKLKLMSSIQTGSDVEKVIDKQLALENSIVELQDVVCKQADMMMSMRAAITYFKETIDKQNQRIAELMYSERRGRPSTWAKEVRMNPFLEEPGVYSKLFTQHTNPCAEITTDSETDNPPSQDEDDDEWKKSPF